MKTIRRLIICGTLLLGLQLNAQETQPTIVGMPGGIRVAPLSDDATACRGKVVNKDGNPVVGHPIILCQDILFPQFYFDHTDKNGEFTVRVNRSNYIAEIGGAGYEKMRFDLDMMRDYNFEQPLTLTYENGVESDISDLLKLKLHRHHYQMDIRQDVVRSLELCPVFRPLERRSQSNAESEIQNIVKRTTYQRQLGETQKRFPIR